MNNDTRRALDYLRMWTDQIEKQIEQASCPSDYAELRNSFQTLGGAVGSLAYIASQEQQRPMKVELERVNAHYNSVFKENQLLSDRNATLENHLGHFKEEARVNEARVFRAFPELMTSSIMKISDEDFERCLARRREILLKEGAANEGLVMAAMNHFCSAFNVRPTSEQGKRAEDYFRNHCSCMKHEHCTCSVNFQTGGLQVHADCGVHGWA